MAIPEVLALIANADQKFQPTAETAKVWDSLLARFTDTQLREAAIAVATRRNYGAPTVGDLINELSFRPDSTNLTMIGCGEEETDIDGWNQGVDMAVVADAFSRVAGRCPLLAQAYFRGGWSGLFDVTPDWHPILDRVEGIEGLYFAVGFSGHGFKESPMIGRSMAELIMGDEPSIDISMLDLKRFAEDRQLRSRYSMQVLA